MRVRATSASLACHRARAKTLFGKRISARARERRFAHPRCHERARCTPRKTRHAPRARQQTHAPSALARPACPSFGLALACPPFI
jgi:hypothetical protein